MKDLTTKTETMKDLTKYFIDLSKLSEEEIKALPHLNFNKHGYYVSASLQKRMYENRLNQYQIYFNCSGTQFTVDSYIPEDKTELTYPEFINLFEGGETIKSDNTETLANALHQVENLEADKAELLEALEEAKSLIDCFVTNHDEIESLIQKMKQ